MRVGCHLFETHGKIKLLTPEEGGVADRPAGEVAWQLRKRDHQTFREGLGTSHIYWEDYWPPRRAEAMKRLREEYDDTVRRFGTQLPGATRAPGPGDPWPCPGLTVQAGPGGTCN